MSKVKIYTLANMTPDLLYQQYETMKKFIKDEDWEFIVLNNTSIIRPKRRKAIKNICKELGLKCLDVRFRSFVSGCSYITGWSLTWLYHRFCRWEKDTIHVIIDSDMFFVKDFNFNEYLGDNQICAIHQRREEYEYLWNGFMIMKGAELPNKNLFNFRLTTINGVRTDTGGMFYYWLKKSPDLKIKYIPNTDHEDVSNSGLLPDAIKSEYKPEYNFQFIEDYILHSRGGSNWNRDTNEFLDAKRNYLYKYLDEVLHNNGEVKRSEELYVYKM